jgi:hypothetical protein
MRWYRCRWRPLSVSACLTSSVIVRTRGVALAKRSARCWALSRPFRLRGLPTIPVGMAPRVSPWWCLRCAWWWLVWLRCWCCRLRVPAAICLVRVWRRAIIFRSIVRRRALRSSSLRLPRACLPSQPLPALRFTSGILRRMVWVMFRRSPCLVCPERLRLCRWWPLPRSSARCWLRCCLAASPALSKIPVFPRLPPACYLWLLWCFRWRRSIVLWRSRCMRCLQVSRMWCMTAWAKGWILRRCRMCVPLVVRWLRSVWRIRSVRWLALSFARLRLRWLASICWFSLLPPVAWLLRACWRCCWN